MYIHVACNIELVPGTVHEYMYPGTINLTTAVVPGSTHVRIHHHHHPVVLFQTLHYQLLRHSKTFSNWETSLTIHIQHNHMVKIEF